MHTLIVYESMYGNTHAIAGGIADGVRSAGEARVVPVGEATTDLVIWADLLVVGGPTHIHGLSGSRTRQNARAAAAKADPPLPLDPSAEGPGIREWLTTLGPVKGRPGAAFDTRIDMPALLSGRASSGIAKALRQRGFRLVAKPESFLVKEDQLVTGEVERARNWGARLASALVSVA